MLRKILLVLWFLGTLNVMAAEENCQTCHSDVQSNCNLTCQQCHLAPRATEVPVANHPAIVANPSSAEWWEEKCVSCHEPQITAFKQSLHYSAAGIIDQTRFLFGKNRQLFVTQPNTWQELKQVKTINQSSVVGVVDHLLAGKCLSCHFASDRRHDVAGRKHAAGCASCHVPIDQQTGKPLNGHRFQKTVSDTVCLTCHSGNRVGADYHGYFEHDYHKQYATPYGAEPQFGAFQHNLVPDVHQQAGLRCVDCHREHVKREQWLRFEGQQPTVKCQDCHGGFNESPTRSQNVAKRFSQTVVSHQPFHQRLRCSACHAQWSYQDYGLHLFLDQSAHYEMWEDYLWQGDGEVTRLLQKQLSLAQQEREKAFSFNKISGLKIPGIWYQAWTFRRWEDPPLGVDTQGKISIIRPLYQYYITFVDSLEQVWLDSQIPVRADGVRGWNWDAYVPHTIGKQGRSCESCHLNPKAAGLGLRPTLEEAAAHPITVPTAPILPGSRLLNTKERERSLKKSDRYKVWRTRAFQADEFLKGLKED